MKVATWRGGIRFTLDDAPDPTADRALVLGVARHGGGLIALLDAEALLGACAAAPLQETA